MRQANDLVTVSSKARAGFDVRRYRDSAYSYALAVDSIRQTTQAIDERLLRAHRRVMNLPLARDELERTTELVMQSIC